MIKKPKSLFKFLLVTNLLLIIFSSFTFGKSLPSPTYDFYVNDFANVLDSKTKEYINQMSDSLEDLTKAQIVVVTVDDIGEESLEDYALELFRKWGIGDIGKNNGVLILLDVGGRQSRIEVGYGLEGALPDGKTGRIQDNYMVPNFKNGDYSLGIKEGYNAVLKEVYYEYGYDSPIKSTQKQEETFKESKSVSNIKIIIIIIIFLFIDFKFFRGMITFSLLRGIGRGGSSGGSSGRGGGGGRSGGGGSSRKW